MTKTKNVKRETNTKRHVVIGVVMVGALSIGAYLAKGALFGGEPSIAPMIVALRDAPVEQRFEQMEKIRARAEHMTEEERDALREQMRQVRIEEMKKRVDEYIDASEAEKDDILDRHLAEMVAQREQMRAQREARGESGEGTRGDGPGGDGPPPAGSATGGSSGEGKDGVGRGGPPAGEGPRGEGRGQWRGPSKQARKARLEGTNPDSMARRMRYMEKLRERAKSKGIEFGPGPGPGRGPGGGGGRGPA